MFFERAQVLPYTWATFEEDLFDKNFEKSPNRVTLEVTKDFLHTLTVKQLIVDSFTIWHHRLQPSKSELTRLGKLDGTRMLYLVLVQFLMANGELNAIGKDETSRLCQ